MPSHGAPAPSGVRHPREWHGDDPRRPIRGVGSGRAFRLAGGHRTLPYGPMKHRDAVRRIRIRYAPVEMTLLDGRVEDQWQHIPV